MQQLSLGPAALDGLHGDVNVLTSSGSGFSQLTSFGVRRTVGNKVDNIMPQSAAQWEAQVLNDTTITLGLTDIAFLFLEEHYAGQLISLSLFWPDN